MEISDWSNINSCYYYETYPECFILFYCRRSKNMRAPRIHTSFLFIDLSLSLCHGSRSMLFFNVGNRLKNVRLFQSPWKTCSGEKQKVCSVREMCCFVTYWVILQYGLHIVKSLKNLLRNMVNSSLITRHIAPFSHYLTTNCFCTGCLHWQYFSMKRAYKN